MPFFLPSLEFRIIRQFEGHLDGNVNVLLWKSFSIRILKLHFFSFLFFSISYVEKSVEIWHKLLRVRALVVNPKEEPNIYIKFASLCRKSGRPNLALRTLVELSGVDLGSFDKRNVPLINPSVSYAIMKHTLQMGDFETARHQLRSILTSLHSSYRNNSNNPDLSRLLAKAHMDSGDLYKIAIIKFGKEVGSIILNDFDLVFMYEFSIFDLFSTLFYRLCSPILL